MLMPLIVVFTHIWRLKAKQAHTGKMISAVNKEVYHTTKELYDVVNSSKQKSGSVCRKGL